MSANPISDPLAFPLPGFTPGEPGYDPNWYDPNYNPYGEPTPPVVPDMGQPAAPPPPDPGPPLEPSPDIGGPPPTELPPGPPPPLPELEQLPRPEHHGPGIPYDPRIGRYESPYDRDAAAAVERVMRGARFGYDWIEFFDDFALGEYPEWQQRAVERQWIFEETGVDPGPLPPRDEYDFIQPLPPRVIRSDDSLVWPWEEGWLPPWDRPHGWTPWFLQAVDTSTRRPGTVFGPPSPFEPPVVIEQQQPRPTAAERRAGAAERDRIIREAAQQAARDAAIRSGAAVVIEGIARAVTRRGLPPGVRDVLFPDTLSPGTISTEEAITRGLPQIPEPVITQPPPLPLPAPPPPEITPPWPTTTAPAPLPSSTPAPSPSSRRTPRPAIPATVPVRIAIGQLSGLWTSVLRRRSASSWPWREPFTDPLTQAFADSAPRVYGSSTPSTTKQPGIGTSPAGAVGTNPLTGSNVATLSWSPPRTPTRTRTREDRCDCKPKKRKKARECNVRGNLQWVSGPKKGKPAGSRCVNFKGKP